MNELDIFSAAMEITSPEERDEYLERVCGDNVELRDRIEELLRSHDRIGSFMDSPALELAGTEGMHPIAERAGAMIGPYKLLQEIGEGGMGVVYMAEQTAPVERRVALKIIKPGMDSRQVIARFEAERQALAMMDHPNIAKVLEAGATDSGRPYFVMELVKGIPIIKYCDEHQLTPRERLALFVPVCRAVQHAHQKGIIHRDLKPSNVLVAEYDHERMPKIIDFGVAKALSQRLTEKTMFTQFGQIVGTLEYMSPEQAKLNQLDIDTRSDIYSLGVLLYELLTGSTPFDPQRLRSSGFEEIMRIIREEDPPKPSTRLRTSATLPSVAADRQTEPNKLPGLISGELDWIVMKALEKHRERRYETAGGFAEDIQRYLSDEPVVACPPSVGYKIRKFTRKHYAAIAVSAALFTILLAAAMVSTWEAMKATKAERRAQEALAEARAAQETEAEARLEAENERNRASQAESQAIQDRDNAHQAELRANADRARAIVSHERAQDALAASLFEQARALRLSGEPGRRWHAMELLQQAERLRGRQRPAIPDAAAEPDESMITKEIRSRSQLRTEAVAALSLRDGRVLRQRSTDDDESASLPVVYAVSPEGQFAVSVSHRLGQRTCDLAVVDSESGSEVARWEGLDQMAFSGSGLALGPGGKRLAAPSTSSQYVTVWEVTDKRQIRELRVWTKPGEARSPSESAILPGTIDRMVFSPDGRYLAAVLASTPKWHVFLWDLEDADAAPVIHSGDSPPASLAVFSPDSGLLAFRTDVHTVTVWNLAEHQVETEIELPTELNGSLGFSCDGRLLGIHGMEVDESQEPGPNAQGVLVVWDVAKNQQFRRFDTGPWLSKAQVAFSSDIRRVAVAGVDGEIQVLDLDGKDPSVTLHHGAAPQSLAWEPEGERLISAGIGSLNVWEFSEPPPLSIEQFEPDAFPGPMGPFSYSPDGRCLAVEKPFVRAPDAKDKLQIGGLVLFERETGKLVRTLQYDASAVYRLLFSHEGQKLARLAFSGLVVWDLETGNETVRMKAGPGTGRELVSAGFREDGTLLVGGHVDYQPTVWEAETADVIWQGSKRPDAAGMAVMSPDAQFVVEFEAYGKGSQNTVRVYDLPTGEQRFQLDTPPVKDHQCRVTVSPDARRILTLCLKGPVTRGLQPWTGQQAWSLTPVEQTWTGSVWDAETGKRQLEMHGASTLATYAFSPDGRYLAIGEANGTVRLWSLEHREELFGWRAWGERAKAPLMYSHLEFTPDSSALSVADPSSSTLHVLQLTQVQSELADIGLDW